MTLSPTLLIPVFKPARPRRFDHSAKPESVGFCPRHWSNISLRALAMKTIIRSVLFTHISSVCLLSGPKAQAVPPTARRVLPQLHNRWKDAMLFLFSRPALETQDLVGIRSFQLVRPTTTPVLALERWPSIPRVPIRQLALWRCPQHHWRDSTLLLELAHSCITRPAAKTRPTEHSLSLTTPRAPSILPVVRERS